MPDLTAAVDDGFVVFMTLTMTWNECTAKAWDAYLENAPTPTALQQSYAYGAAFEDYNAITHRGIIEHEGKAIALCQLFQYRLFKLFPLIVAFKGPVWLTDLSAQEKENILNHIKKNLPVKRHLFALESNLQNIEKITGYRRIITGASTIWINLTQSSDGLRAGLNGKWRNALVKAERSELTLKKMGKKPSDYQWLVDAENQQRKKRKYWALPNSFITAFIESSPKSQPILPLAAIDEKEKVAGMMFLIHGSSATYHLGWSNDIGRHNNAHNLLLWEAIKELKKRDIKYLDLGGINSEDIPGLTRFKIGTGGDITTYAGTFMPKIFG